MSDDNNTLTIEEVAEAIDQMEDALSPRYLESDGEWTGYNKFSTSAIRTAIAALQAYQPWIPVSERLPEPINQTSGVNIKNTYLVARYENCNPKGYFYGYQLARYWKSGWSGIDGSYGLSVTHWMPLPKPPESEG